MPSNRPKSTYGRFARKSKPDFEVFEDRQVSSKKSSTGTDPAVPAASGSSKAEQQQVKARARAEAKLRSRSTTVLTEKSANHPPQRQQSNASAKTGSRATVSVHIDPRHTGKAIITTSKANTATPPPKKAKPTNLTPLKPSRKIVSIGDEDAVKTASSSPISPHSGSSASSHRSWVQGVVSSAKKAAEKLKTFAGSPTKSKPSGKYFKIRGTENQVGMLEKKDIPVRPATAPPRTRISFSGSAKPVKEKPVKGVAGQKHNRASSLYSVQRGFGEKMETPVASPPKKQRQTNHTLPRLALDSHSNCYTSYRTSTGMFDEDELSLPNGSYTCSYEDIAQSLTPNPQFSAHKAQVQPAGSFNNSALSSSPVAQSTPKRDWRNSTLQALMEQFGSSDDELASSIDGRIEAYAKLDAGAGARSSTSGSSSGRSSSPGSVSPSVNSEDEVMENTYVIPVRGSSRMSTKLAAEAKKYEEEKSEPSRQLKRSSRQLNHVKSPAVTGARKSSRLQSGVDTKMGGIDEECEDELADN